ncbi:hypothetical protein ACFCZ3_20320 [Cellulosimicrobium cellulans]|uniref:hypothetical protein n=1 Tax=Cellulosimicrobium cellulans TaxID=1710 RepID=UPI0035E3810A
MTTSTNTLAASIDSAGLAESAIANLKSARDAVSRPYAALEALTEQVRTAAETAALLAAFTPTLPVVDADDPWERSDRPVALSQGAAETIRGSEQALLRLAEAADVALAAVKLRHDSIVSDLDAVSALRFPEPDTKPAPASEPADPWDAERSF